LGGSFNPAHRGHLHVTQEALKRLDLDEIWWLVSPQNPLKPAQGMASLAERLAGARRVARHLPRVRVTDIERRLGTRYTADTLAALHRRFPATRFVWLMGADNLRQIPHWRRWRAIFAGTPIAVFARPSHSLGALGGMAAHRYAAHRLGSGRAGRNLAAAKPPAWIFFAARLEPISATLIRAGRNPDA
jgi:nicotinate-nucleotide adenylyltransferase